jgi:hypothetical protein
VTVERATRRPILELNQTLSRDRRRQLGLVLVIVCAYGLALARAGSSLLPTLLLVAIVALGGVALIHAVADRLRDPNIDKLGYVFAAKLFLLLVLVYAGWVPELDPNAPGFGNDPQRFYFTSLDLAAQGFDPESVPSTNYVGIFYVYAAVFALFGQTPLAPALVNGFASLVTALLVILVAYTLRPVRGPRDWTLGLVMLVPDIMWYDVQTSRETLAMALIAVSTLTAGLYVRTQRNSYGTSQVAIVLIALAGLGLIRTSMMLPVIAIIAFLVIAYGRGAPVRRMLGSLAMLVLAVVIGVVDPMVSQAMSGQSVVFNPFRFYAEPLPSGPGSAAPQVSAPPVSSPTAVLIQPSTGVPVSSEAPPSSPTAAVVQPTVPVPVDAEAPPALNWTDRSIGLLFAARNPMELILFAPIRLLIYVVAPLPNISVELVGLGVGSYAAWTKASNVLSALTYLILFPLALASLTDLVMRRSRSPFLILHAAFWPIMLAIAVGSTQGGVQVIHERYRVMAIPLMLACVWAGQFAPRPLIRWTYIAWIALLVGGAVFYIVYKYVLR